MYFSKLFQALGISSASGSSTANRRRKRPGTYKPRVEHLEGRRLLAVLFVDDDLVQNPDADFTTIQAAVNAAAAGDTIEVAGGTYQEAVNVNKTLTILGNQDGRSAMRRSIDPKKEAIVDTPATGTAGFNLTADDIVLRGFTIQDVLGLAGLPSAGITTSAGASGYDIRYNRIQNNTLGIDLESDGATTTEVRSNYFNDNNQVGVGSGNGILSDGGLTDAEIRANHFTQHNVGSIDIDGGSMLILSGNKLVDDAPLTLSNTTDSQVLNTNGKGSNGDGIVLDNCSDIELQFNIMWESAGSGIKLINSDTLTVHLNISKSNDEDGISLVNTDNSVIRHNYTLKNDRDGIRANGASAGNTFNSNKSGRNGEHDYHDDSVGGLTAGTANTWELNKGKTENRTGLIA
jgi:parallel beta-helix repeat protein